MRSFAIFFIILFCGSFQIWAQKNSPDEKSTVNKEYDENGNLIKYDSTYVWQWNSDSTFNFPFDENLAFGNHFNDFFGEFDTDSIFEKFGFSNKDWLQSFNNEDFFEHFHRSFPDSAIIQNFPFKTDSTFSFHFEDHFPGNFNFPEFEEFQKQFEEQLKQHSYKVPEFSSPEQQEEWEKLMQKQQKEKEELMKKWEGKKL